MVPCGVYFLLCHAHGYLQVNTDHWDHDPAVDIINSKARLSTARVLLQTMATGGLGDRWKALSTAPIRNEITVYGCIMIPSAGVFECGANTVIPLNGKPVKYVDAAALPDTYFS
jgi:hypothetical protein